MLLMLKRAKHISGVPVGNQKTSRFAMAATKAQVSSQLSGRLMKPEKKVFAAAKQRKINPCVMVRTKNCKCDGSHKNI